MNLHRAQAQNGKPSRFAQITQLKNRESCLQMSSHRRHQSAGNKLNEENLGRSKRREKRRFYCLLYTRLYWKEHKLENSAMTVSSEIHKAFSSYLDPNLTKAILFKALYCVKQLGSPVRFKSCQVKHFQGNVMSL